MIDFFDRKKNIYLVTPTQHTHTQLSYYFQNVRDAREWENQKKLKLLYLSANTTSIFFVIILYARVGDLDKKNQENPKKKFKKSKAAKKTSPNRMSSATFMYRIIFFFCSILSKAWKYLLARLIYEK